MATKPITLPRQWASNAVYTTGPFIGQPGKVAASVGVAAEGHRPGAADPTAAEHENYQQERITAWIRDWLFLGNDAGVQNAHIVETAADGRAGLWGLDVDAAADEVSATFTNLGVTLPTVLGTNISGGTVYQADIGNSTGTGFGGTTGSGNATLYYGGMFGSPANARAYYASADATTSGICFVIEHAGTASAMRIIHSGSPGSNGALYVEATSGNSRAVHARGNGTGRAFYGASGSSAGAVAYEAFLNANDGTGFYCQTPVASTSGGRAMRAEARGDARGLEATATSGDAISASSTGTGGAALYFIGRATDPTNTFNGRVDFNTTTGTIVIADQNAAEYRDAWTSRGGSVIGYDDAGVLTNNSSAVYVTACTLSLADTNAPRRAGRTILLRFSFSARTVISGVNTLDIRIRDTTAGVTILENAGVGIAATSGYRIPGIEWSGGAAIASSGWCPPSVIEVAYVVPVAGNRTFVAEFKTATANGVQIRNPLLAPFGLI